MVGHVESGLGGLPAHEQKSCEKAIGEAATRNDLIRDKTDRANNARDLATTVMVDTKPEAERGNCCEDDEKK